MRELTTPHSGSSTADDKNEQRIITYAQAGVEGVREEMRLNPNIFYIGQGIGPRGGNFQQSRGLWDEFGKNACGIHRLQNGARPALA